MFSFFKSCCRVEGNEQSFPLMFAGLCWVPSFTSLPPSPLLSSLPLFFPLFLPSFLIPSSFLEGFFVCDMHALGTNVYVSVWNWVNSSYLLEDLLKCEKNLSRGVLLFHMKMMLLYVYPLDFLCPIPPIGPHSP